MRFLADIIAICWVVFWIYWFISAFRAKRGTIPYNWKPFVGIRLVVIALIVVFVLTSHNLPQELFEKGVENEFLAIFGLIIFLLGMFLAVWARVSIGRNWGMPMTQKEHPELVTNGPYQYVRHPIYGGILLMELGTLLTVSLFWLLVFIATAIYFIYSAYSEERLMTKQFPEKYQTYRSKTKMFLPYIV